MAVPAGEKHGHYGNNYPEHLNAASFLGLPKQDRLNLALLSPGMYNLFAFRKENKLLIIMTSFFFRNSVKV